MLGFEVTRIFCVALCALLLPSLWFTQAGQIGLETFIRERGTYTFDDAGSSIEVITARDNKPSLAFDFRSRHKNSTNSNKMAFDESGILHGDGWFVFVESADRCWIFDGKKSLAIAERRRSAEEIVTSIKDFDAQSAALCPLRVKNALPDEVRNSLFGKHLF